MNKSKPNNAINFRLPEELLAVAEKKAQETGCRNINALGQKVLIAYLNGQLVDISEVSKIETKEVAAQPADYKPQNLEAINNLRQLTLKCFELILDGTLRDESFRSVVQASDHSWEKIGHTENESANRESQSAFSEYSSLVEEFSDEFEDLFSGEKLLVKVPAEKNRDSVYCLTDDSSDKSESNHVDSYINSVN